jgi:hypothetical protein
MQNGLSANTTRGATISVVRPSGGEDGAVAYKGVEGENGPGSALNREDSSDGNRRHQRADSTDSGRAPLAKSQNGGNDTTEGFTQTVRVGPMARARGCISRVSDGTGSDSERSAADGRERRPYRSGEARLISPSSEARAYSAVADIDTHLVPQAPSTGGRPSQQHSQYGSSKILVREGSPGRAPAEARGGKPRGTQYKHYYATIIAHRT